MGTLTAGQPRLAHYCSHKLPTSCRLSSIPECCACADERAHATAYRTYIDGVGDVLRGTRWQRYCWFCKEFWENRVRQSGLRPAQTRIPEVPDQTLFLERWYDFHRGYRIVTKEDGSEEQIALLGENFVNVDPGCLPRTLEELQEGQQQSTWMSDVTTHDHGTTQEEISGPNLDDTLDQMFEAAAAEQDAQTSLDRRVTRPTLPRVSSEDIRRQTTIAVASRTREFQVRRIAALRRELNRMRNGIERVISGLRELGEIVPDPTEATSRLTQLGRTLDDITGPPSHQDAELTVRSVDDLTQGTSATSHNDRSMTSMQTRLEEARHQVEEARRMRDHTTVELSTAEEDFRASQRRLQDLQREQRATENYLRIFGTREEMQAQGEQYESPIGGMFNRAMERYRAAEDVRREQGTLRQLLADEALSGGEEQSRRLAQLESLDRDVWGVPRPRQMSAPQEAELVQGLVHQDTSNTTQLMEMARDEVFAGQDAQSETGDQVASVEGADEADDTEQALHEYYGMLRRQNWNQQMPDQGQAQSIMLDTFQRSTLSGSARMRSREALDAGTRDNTVSGSDLTDTQGTDGETVAARREYDPSRVYLLTSENWLADMRFLLTRIGESDTGSTLHQLSGVLPANAEGSLVRLGELTEVPLQPGNDFVELEALFSIDDLAWTAGLPAEWLRRARREGSPLHITADPTSDGREERRQNTESMAAAFQTSADVRRSSGLVAPEQLRMLYRLQRGIRNVEDLAVLWAMLQNAEVVSRARTVLFSHERGVTHEDASRISRIETERRRLARESDNTRQELDIQRRSTHALALAAGQTATRAGPQGVFDQMMQQVDREYREDVRVSDERRLVGSGLAGSGALTSIISDSRHEVSSPWTRTLYPTSSASESEDLDAEGVGLDAKDSGRPEAKSDEDMTIKLECRICFSQVADTACLPCGHLVMCKWCSDQHSPTLRHDRTRPARPAGCPVCRKGIRQKVRVFRT